MVCWNPISTLPMGKHMSSIFVLPLQFQQTPETHPKFPTAAPQNGNYGLVVLWVRSPSNLNLGAPFSATQMADRGSSQAGGDKAPSIASPHFPYPKQNSFLLIGYKVNFSKQTTHHCQPAPAASSALAEKPALRVALCVFKGPQSRTLPTCSTILL
eukprot:782130-Amphidinium_carterae.1